MSDHAYMLIDCNAGRAAHSSRVIHVIQTMSTVSQCPRMQTEARRRSVEAAGDVVLRGGSIRIQGQGSDDRVNPMLRLFRYERQGKQDAL